jgi:hypothetical protein
MLTKEIMATIRTEMKKVAKKYGAKISVKKQYNTIKIAILSSRIDFEKCALRDGEKNKLQWLKTASVNPYWYMEHWTGDALAFIDELIRIAFDPKFGYYDNSKVEFDYFDVAWRVRLSIGDVDHDYQVID